MDLPSPALDTATAGLLDSEESAIETTDGGDGPPIVVIAGAGGGALAVFALGLLLRRRKRKLQLVTLESSQVIRSSTLTTVHKTPFDTVDKAASGLASANLLPTSKGKIHLDLEKDQLQPILSPAPESNAAGAARSSSDKDPRTAQLAAIEAAAAAAEASEVAEADRVPI